jgi:outer membrane protein assembly factor BamB
MDGYSFSSRTSIKKFRMALSRFSPYLFALSFGLLICNHSNIGVAQIPTDAALAEIDINNDWPWWRGASRDGKTTSGTDIPTEFSETQNVIWKTAVPGRGHGSPIIVKSLVCLPTADEEQQIHSVVAFDRQSGKPLWKQDLSQGGFPARNHPKNTEASSTLASDGTLIFATFFHHKTVELYALSLKGEVVWKKVAGAFDPKMYEYGYAPSPILYQDMVIVTAEYDGESFIKAFRRQDGEEVWSINRPKSISFSSPVIANIADRPQLLLSGQQVVCSYDPSNGKQIWSVIGTTFATCGTMVWDGNNVFASGGFPKAETIAIVGDGSKKVLWRNNKKCYEQSMLAHQGYVYALTDNGIAYCWNGETGEQKWEKRLKGPVSASPVLLGDRILWANEGGSFFVWRATPEKFELLVENQLGDESFASPAVAGGQLFLRVAKQEDGKRQEYLFCIGKK